VLGLGILESAFAQSLVVVSFDYVLAVELNFWWYIRETTLLCSRQNAAPVFVAFFTLLFLGHRQSAAFRVIAVLLDINDGLLDGLCWTYPGLELLAHCCVCRWVVKHKKALKVWCSGGRTNFLSITHVLAFIGVEKIEVLLSPVVFGEHEISTAIFWVIFLLDALQ